MRLCRPSLGPFGVMSLGGARADGPITSPYIPSLWLPSAALSPPPPASGKCPPSTAPAFRIMHRCSASESSTLWVVLGSPPSLQCSYRGCRPQSRSHQWLSIFGAVSSLGSTCLSAASCGWSFGGNLSCTEGVRSVRRCKGVRVGPGRSLNFFKASGSQIGHGLRQAMSMHLWGQLIRRDCGNARA